MTFHKVILIVFFSSFLTVEQSFAGELAPLRPGVLRILQRFNVSAEEVTMTQSQQRLFVARFSTHGSRASIEGQIKAFAVENRYLGSTSPSLRQIVDNDNDNEPTLSARDERRIRRALRRPGVPVIDFNSLSYTEKRQLLAALSTSALDVDFVRIVNSLLASR